MVHFIDPDRKTPYLLPPSMEDWLPEGHLARFIVEVIEQLDVSRLVKQYAGRGCKAYHPATLLAILVYGYANGVFSSRKLEQATYDSVAFRYLAAGSHPDHDTLANFRRRFLGELQNLFVQVLELAQEMKLLKVGRVCLDGTKIHANASKHQALSHGHIEQMERQLKAEVQELFALAEQADQSAIPDGVNLPEEISRRKDRLAVMADAKSKIAARAQARYEREKILYDEKMARRAEREASGQKRLGKAPKAPDPAPKVQDQINLTDEESRIMPVSGGGFEQSYNAQAAVDDQTMLVVATGVSQAPNDKEQVLPMLETLQAQAAALGPIEALVADTGYCSEKNVEACEVLGITHLHCRRSGKSPSGLAAATYRAGSAGRGCHPDAGHDASTEDTSGSRYLPTPQANGSTGLWHHQIGDGLPAVLITRLDTGTGGMEPRLPRVECETHGRIAPIGQENA